MKYSFCKFRTTLNMFKIAFPNFTKKSFRAFVQEMGHYFTRHCPHYREQSCSSAPTTTIYEGTKVSVFSTNMYIATQIFCEINCNYHFSRSAKIDFT